MGQQALHVAVALGRGVVEAIGFDPIVVGLDLGGQRILRIQHSEQSGRREPANGKLLGLVEELPAIQSAVDIIIIEVQQLLVEIGSGFSFHPGKMITPAKRSSHLPASSGWTRLGDSLPISGVKPTTTRMRDKCPNEDFPESRVALPVTLI